MQLMQEQEELLADLVEVERRIPREKRGKFIVMAAGLGSPLSRFAPPDGSRGPTGSLRDAEDLASHGLLAMGFGSGRSPLVWVTPEGYAYYEAMRKTERPAEQAEESIRTFLSSSEFKGTCPNAFRKWSQAETLLWSADAPSQLTTIGHLCREALQEFTTEIAVRLEVDTSGMLPAKTIARLRRILKSPAATSRIGTTEAAFLDALVTYWGCVSDLVQRQEHGAEREGETLVWEDARRIVFQTLVVMFEIYRPGLRAPKRSN